MINISLEKIEQHNPWWRRPEFILEDSFLVEFEKQKFPYYHPFYHKFPLNKSGVLTLRGPRRIGKTTLLKLLIKKLLLTEKIEKENVFFFPCDTVRDFEGLEVVLATYFDYIRPKTDKKLYIFLDEISFVDQWQRTIKYLADSNQFKNTLVLITGSNILDLKYSSERLPGRRGEIYPWDLTFPPLSFHEFVNLVKPDLIGNSLSSSLSLLPLFKKSFNDFLLTGGFPNTINEYYRQGYLKTETYEIFLSWIEGDLHKTKKSEELAYQIIQQLFTHLTTPISLYKLSRETGIVSHMTVDSYLDILGKMFLLAKLPYLSLEQKKVFLRKNRKIYFNDPFIYNTLLAKTQGFTQQAFSFTREMIRNEENKALLIENYVASHLKNNFDRLYFGQNSKKKEIDFVGKKENRYFYLEVKYQNRVKKEEFAWTKDLLGKNQLTVLSKRDYYKKNNLYIVPAEIFLAYGEVCSQ